jgi:hypothetical protein
MSDPTPRHRTINLQIFHYVDFYIPQKLVNIDNENSEVGEQKPNEYKRS